MGVVGICDLDGGLIANSAPNHWVPVALLCRVGDTTNLRQLSGRTLPSERHPDPVEAAIRLAIRNIRYQPPKGTVQAR